MPDDERTRLLFGPYATPAFRYGDIVSCLIRGEIEVVELTDAPIPWSVGKIGNHKSMILYADLVRAVRREAALAVAHWWGVTSQTVRVWRRALGVGAVTEGTSRLKAEAALAEDALRGAHERSRDAALDAPRRGRIAEAKKGKPRPRHVIEAMTRTSRRRPSRLSGHLVSILVVMDHPRGLVPVRHDRPRRGRVSILVVMDHPRGP